MDLMIFSTLSFWIWLYLAGAVAYTELTVVPNAKIVTKTELWTTLNTASRLVTVAVISLCIVLWPLVTVERSIRWILR